MPRVKWGSISESDIDQAEVSRQYAGKYPPSGVYRFILRSLKTGESSTGNPKLIILCILDGSWRQEHKKYDGCPMWDHLAVVESQNFKVRAFCDALGVTSKQFMTQTVEDEDNNILKIGNLKIHGEDLLIYAAVNRVNDPEYGEQIRPARGGGYMPAPEGADDEEEVNDEAGDGEYDE